MGHWVGIASRTQLLAVGYDLDHELLLSCIPCTGNGRRPGLRSHLRATSLRPTSSGARRSTGRSATSGTGSCSSWLRPRGPGASPLLLDSQPPLFIILGPSSASASLSCCCCRSIAAGLPWRMVSRTYWLWWEAGLRQRLQEAKVCTTEVVFRKLWCTWPVCRQRIMK